MIEMIYFAIGLANGLLCLFFYKRKVYEKGVGRDPGRLLLFGKFFRIKEES